MTTEDKPRGLLSFPPEIVHLICQSLCPHCTSGGDTTQFSWEPPCNALLALSWTCRLLRDVAQPMAYHVLPDVPWYLYFPRLVRTLDERPDLASQVHWLNQGRYECGGWNGEDESDLKLLKAVARRRGLQRDDDVGFESAEEEDTSPSKFCFELLLSLTPNLERLVVLVEPDGNYEGTKYHYTAERQRRLGREAASYHRLRRLDIYSDNDWGYGALNPAIGVLLGLAPNLEHLLLSSCNGLIDDGNGTGEHDGDTTVFPESAGSSLRVVEMRNCALNNDDDTAELVREIVEHAPRLERFAYSSQGAFIGEHIEDHFSAPAFLRRLRPARESLTHLDINLTECSLQGPHTVAPEKLRAFSALRSLALDETSFCHHRGDSEAPATCLVDMLPPGLESLLVRAYERSRVWGDLDRLALEAQTCPGLRRVTVCNILRMYSGVNWEEFGEDCRVHREGLERLFARRGVVFEWEESDYD